MKKHTLALSILGTVMGMGAAQAEVTLYDYKEGTSAYQDAFVAGSLSTSKNRGDAQSAYNLDLNASYDRVFSSPNQDLQVQGAASGTVARGSTAGADSTDSYTAAASVTADNYFNAQGDAFWYGSASVAANDSFDDLATTASVGVGYGRVVNATPMAKTISLVDELTRRGVLRGKPAVGVYQQVANIISREDEYRSKYNTTTSADEYQLKWITDIGNTLQASGVMANFGAEGVLKVRQILVDWFFATRKIGWKVRAGVGYVGSNFDGLTNKPLLEVGGEYHHPLNNYTQFSNQATFRSILNDGNNGYNFNNDMSFTHQIDDRIDWVNAWNLAYAKNTVNGDDVTTNTVSSTLNYKLSNKLSYTTTARVANVNGSTDANNPDGTDRALLMGVQYRLQ